MFVCLFFYGVLRHFQQYFSYIVAVSFIGGGNVGKYCFNDEPMLQGPQVLHLILILLTE
jgi:hypothetical protein